MLQLVCNNIYAARVQPPGLPALAGHEPQAHQWHRAIAVAEPHARILQFKDLNMIMLDNCVASIPDSVCNLPKLKFLALINNKQLKSIPECVSSLPALLFLNLKGSPNVEVPQAIREKGTDMGGGMWDLQD